MEKLLAEVKNLLTKTGYKILKETRMTNDKGTVLKLTKGALVNVYDTGTIVCQGKDITGTQECLKELM
ncbi:hypothetical protein H6775_03680 [Candidatus Nomurabacteria bacterium]|nr:hypothetical protein [Candidatus Nomurabacteria bacterium]